MWQPWKSPNKITRSAAIFAMIFTVSAGLCGLTALANSEELIFFGIVETVGIVIGAVGMFACLVAAIIAAVIDAVRKTRAKDNE